MEDESREMQIINIHTFDSKLESIEKTKNKLQLLQVFYPKCMCTV